jgi:hypothetical protein
LILVVSGFYRERESGGWVRSSVREWVGVGWEDEEEVKSGILIERRRDVGGLGWGDVLR